MVTRIRRKSAGAARGFTIVEMLVVMAMLAMLLAIASPIYVRHLETARNTVLKSDLQQMRDAIDKYYSDRGAYPVSLQDLVTSRYLRAIPEDPITQKTDTWVLVGPGDDSQPAPSSGVAGPGVFDVKSGAPGTARTGGKYADW